MEKNRLCSGPNPRCHLAQLQLAIGKTHGPKYHNLRAFRKNKKKRLFSRLCWHCPTSFSSKDCRRITKSSTSLGFGAVQVAGSNLNFWGSISLAHKATHNKATTMRTSVDIGWQYELWIYFYLILILVCYISTFVPSPNTYNVFFQFWSISFHLYLRFAKCPYREDGVPVVSGAPSESRCACDGDCMTRYAASWKVNLSVGK